MQISKPLLIVCAAAILLPLSSLADTDAQIKAREALREKMKQLETEPPPQPTEPAPPVPQMPVKKAPAAKPAPAPKSTPSTVKANPAPAPVKQTPAPSVAATPAAPAKAGFSQVPAGNPAPAGLLTARSMEPLFGARRKKAVADTSAAKPKPVAAVSNPAPRPVSASPSVPAPKPVAQTASPTAPSAANTAPSAATAAGPSSSSKAPAPKQQITRIAQAETGTSTEAPRPPKADPENIARAREALRQKMNELNTQQPTPPPPSPPSDAAAVAAPMPAAAKPVAKSKPPKAAAKPAKTAPQTADSGIFAPLPESRSSAVRNVDLPKTSPAPDASTPPAPVPVAQTPAQPKASASTPPPPVKKAKGAAKGEFKPAPAQSFKPLEAPPSPFGGDKQQRLDELLKQYRADQITPAQYHEQRAKIVAEP